MDWNYFPIFVALVLPFALERMNQHKDTVDKAILCLLIVFATVLALAAKSRSGTAMVLVTYIGWFGMAAVPPHKRLQTVGIGIPVFLLAAYLLVTDSYTLTVRWQDWLASPRLQERILNHVYMVQAFLSHPLLGVGPGQYEAYVQWLGLPSPYPISGSHSALFALLAETGLVGTLSWMGLLCRAAPVLSSGFLDPSTPFRRGPVLSIGILLLSTLFYSMHNPLFTWCMMGVLFALASKPSPFASPVPAVHEEK